MSLLLSYCFKLSISLAVVGIFYHLVLRKLTFYKWNRYYLVVYSVVAFFVPCIDVSPMLQKTQLTTVHFVHWIPVLREEDVLAEPVSSSTSFVDCAAIVIVAGMLVMFIRLLFQLFSFRRLIRKAEIISGEGMKLYHVNKTIIPFSFGSSIFLNRNLHTEAELRDIIRHEFVHVKQKHTVDILWSEILCVLNWYNPFAWLLRAAIRQNLEFIADSKVLQSGIDRKQYQYLLLKVIGNNQFSIASKFNFSSLKKRIAMMNKLNSARFNLVRFLFVLPIIAVLLLAFRSIQPKVQRQSKHKEIVGVQAERIDTVPGPVKSKRTTNKLTTISVDADRYEIQDNKAVVHLSDGTVEDYDLKDARQKEKFETKYGTVISSPVTSTVAEEGVTTVTSPVAVTANTNSHVATTIRSMVSTATAPGVSIATTAPVVTTVNSEGGAMIAPVALGGGTVAIADEAGGRIVGDEEVLVTITKNTNREQLDEIKRKMKEKGFEVNFKEIKYDNEGKLTSISGTLESKDVNANFVAIDFDKLILSKVSDGEHIYFRIYEGEHKTRNRKVVI